MPDFFNTPDHVRVADGAPQGWGEAFAVLPQETPPGDSWSRLVRTLEAPKRQGHHARRERRTSWLIGLASAAVLVMATWSPLSRWLQAPPAATAPAIASVATAAPDTRRVVTPTPSNATVRTAAIDATEKPAMASSPNYHGSVTTAHARDAGAHKARRTTKAMARLAVQPAQTPRSTANDIAATIPATDDIQSLQAQSARLEALVAIARDERVGSASNELLSAELDAGIAAVDASLSHDDLDQSRREQLWQQRVDLLQQLAGVESTARWLAAQGMSNETSLVSVD